MHIRLLSNAIVYILLMLIAVAIRVAQSQCTAGRSELIYAIDSPTEVLTPGYASSSYPANINCRWVLKARPYRRIALTVHSMEIEDHLFTDCDDYLEIRDGELNTAPEIVRRCGSSHMWSVTSSADALFVQFHSDESVQLRGANMTFVDFGMFGFESCAVSCSCPLLEIFKCEIPGCAATDWYAIKDYCYRLWDSSRGATWIDAQNQCNYDRSNLVTFSQAEEYSSVLERFAVSHEFPWIGYFDAESEQTFQSINQKDVTLWPDPFPDLSSRNNDEKDCVYLDLSQNEGTGYEVDDCRTQRPFIYGSTIPYPAPTSVIRHSYATAGVGTATLEVLKKWWPLLAVLLLAAVLVACLCIYKRCGKQRGRVGSTDQQRAQLLSSPQPTPITPPPVVVAVPPPAPPAPPSSFVESVSRTVDHQQQNSVQLQAPMREETLTSFKGTNNTLTGSARDQQQPSWHRRVQNNGDPFGRPHISMLDNVSAISLDEFWQKSGRTWKSQEGTTMF